MRPRTLKTAAEAGDLKAVKSRLASGEKINGRTASGHFPLGGAIINGHANVVRFLLQSGANFNLRSELGWTPLYLAAWKGHVRIVADLLQYGAKLHPRTKKGYNSPDRWTPLHVAAAGGHVNAIRILINAGARIDIKDGEHHTPSQVAVMFEQHAAGRLLTKAITQRRKR